MDYYLYRFYDPTIGRWLSRDDPSEESSGVDIYAFNSNDPVGDIDYLGLVSLSFHIGAFIPNTLGNTVRNAPLSGVSWAQEPNPFSSYWFATDNRANAGPTGTSRVYSFSNSPIDSNDIGNLKSKNIQFTTSTSGSHRILVTTSKSGHGLRNVHAIYTYVPDSLQTQSASTSQNLDVEDTSACESTISLHGSGGYPWGGPIAPNLDYRVKWDLIKDSEGDKVTVTTTGSHNTFPAYEALINNNVIYQYYPTDSGPGLLNLGVYHTDFGPKTNQY